MQENYFDLIETELLKGINLIEASAGTGKTYAIAMLVLRFIVEKNIAIDKLLVVTFTKAATEELKERVRSRLAEARKVINERIASLPSGAPADNTLNDFIDGLVKRGLAPELAKQRLEAALLNIDQAGIFTIHGFCQRILREHALESGELFDAELTGDLTAIKQACADDFWRRQIYKRSAWEAAVLTARYKTPEELLASVDFIADQVSVYPDCVSLDEALQTLKQQACLAKTELDACVASLKNSFAEQKFKVGYTTAFESVYRSLRDWLQGNTTQIPNEAALSLLTENGLMEALHGGKFRANKTRTCDQRKADYLAELAINTAPFDALDKAVKHSVLAFRSALLDTLRTDLDKRLQQLNVLSFDGLISRLSEALRSEKGGLLSAELQNRFTVALIDEFQDTDDSQWGIFSTLFAAPDQYLYLIGDPKQAIYKFRGADIYSYLAAQKQAEHHFTLEKNHRSHPQLVTAVNALFQREQAFLLDELTFNAVKPAKSALDGALYKAKQALPPMMLWQLPESDSSTGYWTAGKAAQEIRLAIVNEVIDLLATDYRLQPAHSALQAKDIAILVRTNAQAGEYQTALRAAGLPSVINSTESVFASPEAADLYILLQAVASPGDSALLKQALTLSWFDLDGQTLYQLINNETALEAWMARFTEYYQSWQHAGLLAMMQYLLTRENIRSALSKSILAERQLTNLHHLIELIQQAAGDEHLGINKTLHWLRTAIAKADAGEDQQLRLESDEDAVKIVTMHRCKGLEYAVVFCPCLWQRNDRLQSESRLIKCHKNGRMVVDLGSEDFELHRNQAFKEELAEDLRMFYVAVTRAKYRCYIVWADVRFEKTANASAMAWLLGFAEADFSTQQGILQAFCNQLADAFDYRMLEVPGTIKSVYQKPALSADFVAKKRKRSLYTRWQMSSYTALSALSLQDTPELPQDKAQEQAGISFQPVETPEESPLDLPRGVPTGNVVHDLLENNTFSDLAGGKNIAVQRDQACRRYGLKLEKPEVIDALLQTVVSTPLSETDADFRLMNLPELHCLKEMPFYLAMHLMDANQINTLLQDTPAFQSLTDQQMCGYLTGFIDLICQYNGRYYVMDYKTNQLPDYSPETLTDAMREHNYGLQYWLYTVVLHRYLQIRLPDYHYETHFGGVRYLFVRGMQPKLMMRGIYQDRPDIDRIQALAALFGGDNAR